MPTSDRINNALSLAARGDAEAWRQIIEEYGRRVFGLIRARCGDPELAEEIVQSCFCTVAVKLQNGGYLEQGKFEAWLFRIAINRLRDEMRRKARQAITTDSTTLAALADHRAVRKARTSAVAGRGTRNFNPESGMSGFASKAALSNHGISGSSDRTSSAGLPFAGRFEALNLALKQLPDADVEILHMRHQGGLAFKQIAIALEQPLGTVLARHHRALNKLRELLDDMED